MLHRLAPWLYLLLLALAVPWYWPSTSHAVWLGLPAWVCVAIMVSLAASVLTALLMARPWPDEHLDDD